MKKRLALFLDGTWNDPDDGTNVRTLHDLVVTGVVDGVRPEPYYRKGVGTDWYNRIIGGAVGAGLSANVLHAYEWLVSQYDDGDEIFVFGFSRGAYTARSIVGVIINCGLLRRGMSLTCAQVFERYRRGKGAVPLYKLLRMSETERVALAGPERELMRCSRRVGVKFVGVWDTVGALGVPWTEAPLVGRRNFYFHNTNLSVLIDHAYHAMAVDEHRGPYKPTLWTKFTPAVPDPPDRVDSTGAGAPARAAQEVEQRWFIGAHSDVGGGGAENLLRRLPLRWLQQKAEACGLRFREPVAVSDDAYRAYPSDSYARFLGGAYRFLRLGSRFFRPIGAGRREVARGWSEPVRETIDGSVFMRYQEFPSYRPTNLEKWAKSRGVDLMTQRGECQA